MFGFIIKKIRESRNFSQEYMAFNLNITQAAYSKIESDKTNLSIKKMFEICRLLGITEADILNGAGKLSGAGKKNPTANFQYKEEYISSLKKMIEIYEKDNERLKSTNERLIQIIERGKETT